MPYIDLDGDTLVAHTDWSERELIRQVPGMSWDPNRKAWKAAPSWAVCLTLRGVFGDRLRVGPALEAWARDELESRVNPAMALRSLTEGVDLGITAVNGYKPLAFQGPGASFLTWAKRACLADEMGGGKTTTAVLALRILREAGHRAHPVVVIVPNSTKTTPWAETFANWDPDVRVFVITGSAAKRLKLLDEARTASEAGEPVAVIINWEAVRLHSRLAPYGSVRLARCTEHGGVDPELPASRCEVHPKELNLFGFRTVIADEAHKMKDPKSKQTRAVWAVQHGPTVEYAWALTGTPVANHPGDAWSLMHGVAPEDYPTRTKFIDRYCLMSWNTFGGMNIIGVKQETKDEFFGFFDPRFRRMPKALVLQFLPPKVRSVRHAEMGGKQAKAYKDIEEGRITRLDDGRVVLTTNSLVQNLRLLQFSSSYATVDDDGHVRLSEPSSKLDVLDEIIDEHGEDRSLAVCAESRQLIELASARLTKAKVPHSLIVGGMTDDERNQSLRLFQDRTHKIMLFTMKAGGIGLTMTAADTIVFLQRSWSMIDNKQAEDRVHRIGSEIHESIHIIDIVAPGTVEVDQIASLHEKMARLEEIARDKATLERAATLGDDGARLQLAALEAEEAVILSSDLVPHLEHEGAQV